MNYLKKIIEKIKEGALKEALSELAWIYRYGLRYKEGILWYMFLGVLGVVVGLGGSVLSKYIIDAVTGYDFDGIIPLAIAYILMQVVQISTNAWTSRISTKIEIKVDQEIRADVYDKILDADWQAIQEYHSGDLLNRLNSDVSSVASSVLGWVPNFVTRSIQFVGILCVILYYDPTLAVLALLSAPVTFLVSYTLMKKMRHYNKRMRQVSSEVVSFNGESLRNIQIIKSFGLTELYGKKLRGVQEKYRDERLEYNKFSILTSTFMSIMGTTISIICFGWGIYRLWSGHITYGTMTLFLQLSSTLTNSFSAIVRMVPTAISAATSAGRIMAVTELPKEKYVNEEQVLALLEQRQGVTVEVKDAQFSYASGKEVFSGANVLARPGEIIALIGPSGEGKTTMLRLLLGLIAPQKGSVTISGIPVSAATRQLFSYVPQDNMMFSGTIAENLRMTKKDASDEELIEALKQACAYDFVFRNKEGLETIVKEQGGGFSEGQIQRLSIARAILSKAPVLLMDEATSALDSETEELVLRNIMKADKTRTCIVTTHRPSVLKMCDRIYRISDHTVKEVKE